MPYYRTHNVTYNFTAVPRNGAIIYLQAIIPVRIDTSASERRHAALTDVYVNQLLDLNAQQIGVMRRDYDPQNQNAGGWHGGTYRVDMADGLYMLFGWNNHYQCPYLYHVELPRQDYHTEKRKAFKNWQDRAFGGSGGASSQIK